MLYFRTKFDQNRYADASWEAGVSNFNIRSLTLTLTSDLYDGKSSLIAIWALLLFCGTKVEQTWYADALWEVNVLCQELGHCDVILDLWFL